MDPGERFRSLRTTLSWRLVILQVIGMDFTASTAPPLPLLLLITISIRCLTEVVVATYPLGPTGHMPRLSNRDEVNGTFVLDMGNWDTSALTTLLLAILAEEVVRPNNTKVSILSNPRSPFHHLHVLARFQ